MDETLTYSYNILSTLTQNNGQDELQLAKFSEIQKASDAPCFFIGKVKQPFIMARCLVTLANVVKASLTCRPRSWRCSKIRLSAQVMRGCVLRVFPTAPGCMRGSIFCRTD